MADDDRKTERIQVLMTPDELEALDDWAFANRIRSRGEAIRRLIEAGLGKTPASAPSGGSTPGSARKPASAKKTAVPRAKKPTASDRQAKPAQSKEAQIRALREQGTQ
jgi:hypothetical protein